MKRYIVASTQRKKTTIKLLKSLVNSDKVFYMSAAMEKSWSKKAMGRYYDPSVLVGDCYFKVARVYTYGDIEDPDNTWVILHPSYIQDNEIVAGFADGDLFNDEYTYAQMPSTLTIMTEDEAIAKLNSIIEANKLAKLNNYATDEEVEEIYNIVKSGRGFIAVSPSNKRYLIVDGNTRTANAQEVHVVKYPLIRDLVPRTYKNSDILRDKTGYIYTINTGCKKDEQGNIIIRGSKLRFNTSNLEIVSKQEVANILNRIYDAVQYRMGPYYTYDYYDEPYYPNRPWNNN